MATNPSEIPEWVQSMRYLFGEKWGAFLSRVMVFGILTTVIGIPITVILANSKSAIENLSLWLSKLPLIFNNPIGYAISSLIFLVIAFAFIFALFTLLAAIPAQFLRTFFDIPFRIRINDTLIGLLALLKKAEIDNLDKSQIKQLIIDTEFLFNKWQKSKTNRLSSWIVPTYLKKGGTEKWKIVSVNESKDSKKK